MKPAQTLNHDEIAARIPHQGSMCLLDRVVAWDENRIVCRAVSHRDANNSHRDAANPLRAADRLGAANGIEYAAQAMAVHAALLTTGGERPKAGYLTSVRSVNLHVARLDDIAAELEIVAERQSGDAASVLYSFTISTAGQLLLDGRVTAVLDAESYGRRE